LFSLGTPVSSTNKTDRHDITEILLKVALNTIKQTNNIVLADRICLLSLYNINLPFTVLKKNKGKNKTTPPPPKENHKKTIT